MVRALVKLRAPGSMRKQSSSKALVVLWAVAAAVDVVPASSLTTSLGGGNVGTNGGNVSALTLAQLDVLQALGADSCRTNLYPGSYIKNGKDWDTPSPEVMDEVMSAAMRRNIRPVVLLEYYAPQYVQSSGFGNWGQWYGIGRAFATHLRPGGTWAAANNAPSGFGVTDYTAFNEPDGGAGFTAGSNPGPAGYAMALNALSTGIKSIDPSLRVSAGGFMSVNAHQDCTLRGLGKMLAPLWNNGTLDTLDLHTYMDVQYAPMENSYHSSAQANFDCVKRASGITNQQLRFTTTEFNYKERLVDEAVAARGLLTAVFDNVGIVNADNTPVSDRSFPWNVFNTPAQDLAYGMAQSLNPYKPTKRGCVLARTWGLLKTVPWAWDSADPRGTGIYKLSAPGQTLTVWQNRKAWTSLDGESITLTAVPAGAVTLDVYGWDGLRRSLSVSGPRAPVRVEGLSVNETHLLHAHSGAPGAGLSKLVPACPLKAGIKTDDQLGEVWYGPSTFSSDLLELFTKPHAWSNTRQQVTTLNLPVQMFNQGWPGWKKLQSVAAVNTWASSGGKLAIEAGAVKGYDCEGSGNMQAIQNAIDLIQAHDGKTHYVAFDEPLIAGTESKLSGGCSMTQNETAQRVASIIKKLRAAPNSAGVAIGDIAPYPSLSATQLTSWIETLSSLGAKPNFLHIDVNFAFADRNPQINLVEDLRALQRAAKAAGILFGVILWPGYDPIADDLS